MVVLEKRETLEAYGYTEHTEKMALVVEDRAVGCRLCFSGVSRA